MSADVIERITELEREMRARYEQAAAENRQKLAAARHALERRNEDSRRISEADERGALEAAANEAAEERHRILQRAKEDCGALVSEARGRMDGVADWIVERVVNN